MRPVLALLLTLLLAAPAAAADEYEFRDLSEPQYTQFVVEEHSVPTPYGTIYGWTRRPVGAPEAPVILRYSPYTVLESQQPGSDPLTGHYNPRGYAVAFFHLVGTGWSGGCTDYGGVRERRTAAAVVDFLGSREWANGKVGMIGGSYDGTTQWAAAVEQPEHLATIVPQVAISRWYDYAFGQGVRFLSGYLTPLAFDYGFNQAPVAANDPSKLPLQEKLVDDVRPCDNVEHQVRGYMHDPVHDGWWDERDYRAMAGRVEVPALIEGSWSDYNVHAVNTIAMWEEVEGRDPRHKLVMGLQGHGVPRFVPIDELHHAWFDRYLLGRDTGVEAVPRVQSELTGPETPEADSPSWPPPGTKAERLELGTDLAGADRTWRDVNPQLSQGDAAAGNGGEAAIRFLGAPEARESRLVGRPRLTLTVTTDQEETQVTPVLFEQTASGARTILTRGLLNALNRKGVDTSEPLAPGVPWTGTVEFQPLDHVLQEGSVLGVALMSMNANEALAPDDAPGATNVLEAGVLELERAPSPR
jgi:X-Pro dipeptidyl-peptidase